MKIIIILSILCSELLSQSVLNNQEFKVNTTTKKKYLNTEICELSDSGFVICWTSGSSWSYDIYGQIFDMNGLKKGAEFMINKQTVGIQTHPSVSRINKKFFVCWQSDYPEPGYPNISGRIFNNDGTVSRDEFTINTSTNYYQSSPNVCSLENGNFVVTWSSNHQTGSFSDYNIFAQIFNSFGNKIGDEFQVNATNGENHTNPQIGKLDNTGFVICWDSYSEGNPNDPGGSDVHAKEYSINGAAIASEFIVTDYRSSNITYPDFCSLSDGKFVICYQQSMVSVRMKRYNSKDSLGVGQLVSSQPSNGGARIYSFNDDKFFVCWADGDIYSQLFFPSGMKNGNVFRINSITDGTQLNPTIAGFLKNGSIVCWTTENRDETSNGIFARYSVNHSLKPYNLLIPENDHTSNATHVEFKWNSASDLPSVFPWDLEYTIYIDEDPELASPIKISNIFDTTYVAELTRGTTYFWKVLAKNIAGDSLWSSETNAFFVDWNATAIETENRNPTKFELFQNYPNPFNPETTIEYNLPQNQPVYRVTVKIYNVPGQLITTLINEPQNPGSHTVKWNAAEYPSGVYFCRINAGQYFATQKMLLVR